MDDDKTSTPKSAYLEGERLAHFKSLSGMEYKEVYTPEDIKREMAHNMISCYILSQLSFCKLCHSLFFLIRRHIIIYSS